MLGAMREVGSGAILTGAVPPDRTLKPGACVIVYNYHVEEGKRYYTVVGVNPVDGKVTAEARITEGMLRSIVPMPLSEDKLVVPGARKVRVRK